MALTRDLAMRPLHTLTQVKIVNETPTFRAKAKPQVDDDNLNHVPGGGKVLRAVWAGD